MATQPERIAALEKFETSHTKSFGVVLKGGIAWLCFVTLGLVAIQVQLQGIKQGLADGGVKLAVNELTHPKSDRALSAALASVSAEILNASAAGVKPNPKKLLPLSSAVSEVLDRNPDTPKAWETAMQLVTYRSTDWTSGLVQPLPNCLDKFDMAETNGRAKINEQVVLRIDKVISHGCELVLDDLEKFATATATAEWIKTPPEERHLIQFQLRYARIVYHGGETIPFSSIVCQDCQFDIDGQGKPAMPVQQMTRQLLLAKDYSHLNLNVRS